MGMDKWPLSVQQMRQTDYRVRSPMTAQRPDLQEQVWMMYLTSPFAFWLVVSIGIVVVEVALLALIVALVAALGGGCTAHAATRRGWYIYRHGGRSPLGGEVTWE